MHPVISRRKISRISARLRWIAGTRMWDGRSWPSCTISSARSVSYAAMPASASASFRPISWVTIDFTFTTSVSPVACTSRVTIALASFASDAQCTVPPRLVTSRSSRSRCSSRRAMVAALTCWPATRSCSQSGTSPTTRARLARIVWVAWPMLRRSWVSASARRAAAGNGSSARSCPTPRGACTGMPRNVALTASPPARPRSRRGSRRGAGCGCRCAAGTARRRCASGTTRRRR